MDHDVDSKDIEQPREVRRGHLSQWRAKVRNDRVRVELQKRKHRFGEGTTAQGRALPIWEGSLGEAIRLQEMLELLLYDEEEFNYARE